MECIVFIGLQGSGKSAFFKERFADTHLRLNLDMLKTRSRETRFFALCLETRMRCVIDNTNPKAADRARYLVPAQTAGYKLIGYFFDVPVSDALARIAGRPAPRRVPIPGLLGTAKRLERPTLAEGFDELHRVQLVEGRFMVEPFSE